VYVAQKRGNDFYFTGKITTPLSTGESVTVGAMFGLLGVLAFSSANTQKAELKIDYKTGGFIRPWQKSK
jgi:hypothetical protein